MIAINMEMPKDCKECWFGCECVKMDDMAICFISPKTRAELKMRPIKELMESCPLIEIPDEAIVIADSSMGIIQHGKVKFYERWGERREE